jgi:phosphatidylglycerol:prolipoprotein diacylglycerol transferase
MLSTLFRLPTELAVAGVRLPLFGPWSLGTLVWVLVASIVLVRSSSRHGLGAAVRAHGLALAAAGALVAFVLPALDDGGGVPIRGYGVMLVLAAAAGTWLSIDAARRKGIDADTILSLATTVFLWGLVGARLFYVLQYRERFFREGVPAFDSLRAILDLSAGGLVVFGSLPTAGLAAWAFARRRSIPFLTLLDCAAPGMLLGLAIGRIGCFLNGCCYGGPCDLPWAVRFPPESPPWIDQVRRGLLPPPAADGGASWSLPVHPTQLYSALDAALLCGLVVAFRPFARREGEVFALALTLHPISRMLLEAIRVDEPAALGTPLSISQVISIVLLVCAAVTWSIVLAGRLSGTVALGDGWPPNDEPRDAAVRKAIGPNPDGKEGSVHG